MRTKTIDPGSLHRVLLVRLDRLGDLVLTLPAVYALHQRYPHLALSMLVADQQAELLEGRSYLTEVIPFRRGGLRWLRTLQQLRQARFDAALQLLPGNDWLGSWLVAASGAPVTVGYRVGWAGRLLNHPVAPVAPAYEVDNVLAIVQAIAPEVEFSGWGLVVAAQDGSRAEALLRAQGIGEGEPFMLVHPAASSANLHKAWPLERYAQLLSKVIAGSRIRVCVIGGAADEAEKGKGLQEQLGPQVINLAGRLSLNMLAAVLSRATLFVGNNSGPLQMAVALQIPTVSLMGPSSAERWAPRGPGHIVLKKQLACVPCEGRRKVCYEARCMQLITVEEVYQAVQAQLGRVGL